MHAIQPKRNVVLAALLNSTPVALVMALVMPFVSLGQRITSIKSDAARFAAIVLSLSVTLGVVLGLALVALHRMNVS